MFYLKLLLHFFTLFYLFSFNSFGLNVLPLQTRHINFHCLPSYSTIHFLIMIYFYTIIQSIRLFYYCGVMQFSLLFELWSFDTVIYVVLLNGQWFINLVYWTFRFDSFLPMFNFSLIINVLSHYQNKYFYTEGSYPLSINNLLNHAVRKQISPKAGEGC